MSSKLLLRIAAILIFVHLLGHSVGHMTWDRPDDPGMQTIVDKMKSYSAPFMGATKSMADYYNGYSLIIFGLYGASICMLWFASDMIKDNISIIRKMLLPVGVAYLYFGVVEFLFFFPFAACMSFLAGVLTLTAILRVRTRLS